MTVEIAYRMTRLRAEADHERLTAGRRRVSVRARLGHALMFLGCLVEGAGSHESDHGESLKARGGHGRWRLPTTRRDSVCA